VRDAVLGAEFVFNLAGQVSHVDSMNDPLFDLDVNTTSQFALLELLRRENFWALLSNGARMSAQASGWDDVVPVGRELYAAAPDRCLFGTDWPHTHSHHEGGGPQESELIELMYRFLPDAAARRAVLVDNPARLYGFEGGE